MKSLRLQIACLVLMLLAASGQCVVACANQLCGNPAPACHRHHPPKQKGAPQTCSHSLFVADTRVSPNVGAKPPAGGAVHNPVLQWSSAAVQAAAARPLSPAASPPLALSTVLRI